MPPVPVAPSRPRSESAAASRAALVLNAPLSALAGSMSSCCTASADTANPGQRGLRVGQPQRGEQAGQGRDRAAGRHRGQGRGEAAEQHA